MNRYAPNNRFIRRALITVIVIAIIVLSFIFGPKYYVQYQRDCERKAINDSLQSENKDIRELCAYHQMLSCGHGYSRSFQILEKTENPQYAFALANLKDRIYESFRKDSKEAYEVSYLYLKAAELGHPTAQAELSRRLMNGNGVDRNYDLAYMWANKSAQKNDSVGIYALGTCLIKGYGTCQDVDSGYNLIKKSAEMGYERAQQKLMKYYSDYSNSSKE